MIRVTRLGDTQLGALEMHVFDPCHIEWAEEHPEDAFPGHMDGDVLVVTDREKAWRTLIDIANACDDEGDVEFRDALARIASRILRAKEAE